MQILGTVGTLLLLMVSDGTAQNQQLVSSANRQGSDRRSAQNAPLRDVVEGSVRGPNGQAVSAALVMAQRSDAHATALQTRTDAGGHFRLDIGRSGTFVVTVVAPGLAPKTIDRVRPGTRLTISLIKGGVIEGFVRDVGGRPVAEALITAQSGRRLTPDGDLNARQAEVRTDRSGRYRLESLDSDLYTIAAAASGFLRASKPNVRAGSTVNLVLVAGGTTLRGVVTTAGRQPIAGAIVRAEVEPRFFPRGPEAVTDTSGRFEIPGLLPGTYQLIAHARGFAPAIQSQVEIEDGASTADADLVLVTGATVLGKVLDTDGRPLRATLALQEAQGHPVAADLSDRLSGHTDLDGRFAIQRVPPGAYTFAVGVEKHGRSLLYVEVPTAQATVNIGSIVVERGLAITGRVVTERGAPVPEAIVSASEEPNTYGGPSLGARTDDQGLFVLTGLRASKYAISATAPGFGVAWVHSAQVGSHDIQLKLPGAGGITGLVVGDQSRPVDAYRVRLESVAQLGEDALDQALASADGRFMLDDVVPGKYSLHILVPDRAAIVLSGISVSSGRVSDIGTVHSSRGGTVVGSVVDATGVGIAGAAVRIRDAGRDRMDWLEGLVTDADGHFDAPGIGFGAVVVAATHPDYAPTELTTEITSDSPSAEARLVMERGGTIVGTARRRAGTPMSGYLVSISNPGGGPPVRTSDEGTFRIDHVPSGPAVVTLFAPISSVRSLSIMSRDVSVREAEVVTVEFVSREVLVSGGVSKDGEPLTGLLMEFIPARASLITMASNAANPFGADAARQPLHAVSRSDGSFRLMIDQPGQYEVVSRSADGRTRFRTVQLEIPDVASQTVEIDLTSITVAGAVFDQASQRPVVGATLQAVPKNPVAGIVLIGQTAPDGWFTIEMTEAGRYRLSVRAEGYAPSGLDIDVSRAGLNDIRIELERGVFIVGRVVDSGGSAVGGARVEAVAAVDTDAVSWAGSQTDSTGLFKLGGLARVPHNLCAGTPNGSFAIATNVLPEDDERPAVLSLAPGGQVQLVVTRRDGAPVPNVTVGVAKVNGARLAVPYGMGRSDASGSIRVFSPPGVVEVNVSTDTEEFVTTLSVAPGSTASGTVQLRSAGVKTANE